MGDCTNCKYRENMCKWPCNDCVKGDKWEERPLTKADHIRSLTDDMQLAIFFASVSGCPYDREIALDKCELWDNACVSCWLDWLQKEVEE